jgi:hypothetical protein
VNARRPFDAADFPVIASEAKQSPSRCALPSRLPRRFAPRNDSWGTLWFASRLVVTPVFERMQVGIAGSLRFSQRQLGDMVGDPAFGF